MLEAGFREEQKDQQPVRVDSGNSRELEGTQPRQVYGAKQAASMGAGRADGVLARLISLKGHRD